MVALRSHDRTPQHTEDGVSVTSRRTLRQVGAYGAWGLVAVVTILPIYWMVVVSARTRVELFDNPTMFEDSFYTPNYARPFGSTFRSYLINSVIIATGNAILVTTLALLSSYALSRWRLRGSDNIFFWTITNRMAPPAAFLLPIFLLFTRAFRIGDWTPFDTHAGLIFVYCVFNLPFAFWLMKSVVDSVPEELDEAAMVDGASTRSVMRYVIVPLAGPGIAITALLTWVFAWNEYLFAASLTSVEARTITTGLAEFVTVTGTNWGEMAAVSVVSLIPAVFVLLAAQRHIVSGLTFGAVK
jgi:glycerol transport system permease protein